MEAAEGWGEEECDYEDGEDGTGERGSRRGGFRGSGGSKGRVTSLRSFFAVTIWFFVWVYEKHLEGAIMAGGFCFAFCNWVIIPK